MKKIDIYDVKMLLKKVSNSLEDDNALREEFQWYSQANFTIASEYYGELKLFLTKVLIIEQVQVPYIKELKRLLKQLNKIWP